MARTTTSDQRFRLTASIVASFFKHRCDRLFRWNSIEPGTRGKPGIGWNVPVKKRAHSRPGIARLMAAGDEFEVDNVKQLIEEVGEARLRYEGVEESDGGRRQIRVLQFETVAEELRGGLAPEYFAQIEIVFTPEQERRFLEGFGLDPARIKLGSARPDLLQVLPPEEPGGARRLRIWDFKGSQSARHEHFIQVAYYSFLLEHALRETGITGVEVDTAFAKIRARGEDVEFELGPYRLAVEDFLRNHAPRLFATPAVDAHFHLQEGCAMCEYMDTCRAEADAGNDLSRIAYISSESKRRLRAAGITTHRQLAAVADAATIERLRTITHDLSVNLPRYIEAARSLEDGMPRPLGTTSLLMPRWENIRIVISAEQDAVTGTCFALGIKTYEGWDAEANRPVGEEKVFIAAAPQSETDILLSFLRTLNRLLGRIDAENRIVGDAPLDEEPTVAAAIAAHEAAVAALDEYKALHNPIRKTHPDYESLIAGREALAAAEKEAKSAITQARKDALFERFKLQKTLHFYVYDSLDLLIVKGLVERHLFDSAHEGLLEEIRHLVRLFPPESVLPDAETFRTVPGTIVTQVLRSTVALPTPYIFDLKSVSDLYQPHSRDGAENGFTFRPRYGFGWEHSNQVAFERIHDLWEGNTFAPDPRDPSRNMEPDAIRAGIEQTVLSKLRATDSVVRRLKEDLGEKLLLRKEPFRLHTAFDPIDFQTLEALRIFTMLEASLDELAVKGEHTLSIEDRTSKLLCIRGLRYQDGKDEADGSLWFTFDPASRDANFETGKFNLVVTPESQPNILLGDIDGKLFERALWRYTNFQVTLVDFDLASDPPRVRLLPKNLVKFRESIDLSQPCVLDKLFTDYNSGKTLDVIQRLQDAPEAARHIHELVASGTVEGWSPFVDDPDAVERELLERAAATGSNSILNSGQRHAFHGVFGAPLTLVWGPPGTGKTYTVAHILIGYALAARRQQRPIRILVTAFTHHAIANVLLKVAELAERYGIGGEDLSIGKLQGAEPNPADDALPARVEMWEDKKVSAHLDGARCVIVGATVWATHKGMKEAGATIQQWFDLVLIDEASQMRIPDALIAFAASRATGSIILAGDDQQLPPIIHGTYPEEHEKMLGSVFSFMRERMNLRMESEPDVEDRMLFQLDENFRMNEPLTAYPRDVLYRGRFASSKPGIRIRTSRALDAVGSDPIEAMLDPERPVVLCWYSPPTSFTSRNPIEAELVARLSSVLAETLLDEDGGALYDGAKLASSGLAVLSPHRAQNAAIRMMLSESGFGGDDRPLPLVDTVEKMQGKERDVVLVSYGVADEEYAAAEAEFLLSRNRFNVAATRARRKLVVFCSDVVLDVVPDDRIVLLESMMLKEFRRYCSDGHLQMPWMSAAHGEITLNIQWRGFPA